MSQPSPAGEVTARIIYWGAEGAGKSSSLLAIHGKLKPDHRGDLKQVPTRLDPTVTYEEFPIQLGTLNGTRTMLQVVAVPGSPELAPTRKQLLDQMDGIVLVFDSRAERLEDNLAALTELRQSLAAYGRRLEDVPTVVQYNKRDLGDPFAIEELHRRLGLPDIAVFETIATDGTGVLQALTTISKRVVRVMRERNLEPEPPARPTPPQAAAVPESPSLTAPIARGGAARVGSGQPSPARRPAHRPVEDAILAEGEGRGGSVAETVRSAQAELDASWPAPPPGGPAGARIGADLKVVSVGNAARAGERAVRVPIVLGNDDGETVTLALTIELSPLLDGEKD